MKKGAERSRETDWSETQWVQNQQERKRMGDGGGEGAQKQTPGIKREICSSVGIRHPFLRRQEGMGGDSVQMGLNNRTPRSFYLEKAHRRVSEHLHTVGSMRCLRRREKEGERTTRPPLLLWGPGHHAKVSVHNWLVEKHSASSCTPKTVTGHSFTCCSHYHRDGESAKVEQSLRWQGAKNNRFQQKRFKRIQVFCSRREDEGKI